MEKKEKKNLPITALSVRFLDKKGHNLFSNLRLSQHLVGTNDRLSHKTLFSGAH